MAVTQKGANVAIDVQALNRALSITGRREPLPSLDLARLLPRFRGRTKR